MLPAVAEVSADRDRAEALARRVTVGIVTALPEERAAMRSMLEGPVRWSAEGRGAGRAYDLGEITAHDGGKHVVALALAGMGNNSAASRGALLLSHFPEIEGVLMVGIAGGVPNAERAGEHVRLGDVVVSDRRGVIQYDFIKKTARITEARFSPRPPHARLLEAAHLLESDAIAGARPWEEHVKRAAGLQGAARPEATTDVLLASKAPFQPMKHPEDRHRVDGQPRIFFGPIASANILLKDPVRRDRLRNQYGVKAVEMEGSGVADATWEAGAGYLVVRGICDYCDRNKNDDWHMYAAVVAAAYARAVVERMASHRDKEGAGKEQGGAETKKGGAAGVPVAGEGPAPNNLRARNTYFRGREDELRRLDATLRQDRQATVTQASVFGLGGVGKSALALEYAYRALDRGDYPGGIWWVAAEGDPVDALVRLAPTLRANGPDEVKRRLPPGETKAEAIADEVRVALQAQRAPSLLVLDNLSVPGWGKWAPAGAARVLATTRDEGQAIGKAQRLEVLPKEQARAVAEAIAGVARDAAEGEARDRVVVTELGGLAVAVEMAARGTKRWFGGSWVAYERVLREEMEKVLEDPKLVGDYGRGVFAALDLSIDACDPGARALLEGAAVFAPDGVPVEWALAAAGMGAEGLEAKGLEAKQALGGLRELGLVTEDEAGGTVSMHRLVHRRVRGRAEREHKEAWDEALRRGVKVVAEWGSWAVESRQTRAEMDEIEARGEHMRQALEAAETAGDKRVWIEIANTFATHLRNQARYEEALRLCQMALTRAEELIPVDLRLVASNLSNLSLIHKDLGQLADAGALNERALAIAEATCGASGLEVATILSNLALVYKDLAQPAAARPLLERALRIHEGTYGSDHPHVARSLSNLAQVHKDLGELAVACAMHERVLAIHEAGYGPDHPNVAISLSNLAQVQLELGKPALARPMFERALAIDEATYGVTHPAVARSLSNLALAFRELGHTVVARPLFERALAINEAAYGRNHPDVARSLLNLALVHQDLGQPAAARPLTERALTIDEATYGSSHPAVARGLLSLAKVHKQLGEHPAARPLLERALAIYEATYGSSHTSVAIALSLLGLVLLKLGQPAEARSLLDRALRIEEAARGAGHPNVAVALSNLASVHKNLKQAPVALPLLERALSISECAYGPYHPNVALILSNLATVHMNLGQAAGARPLVERALASTEKTYAPDHPTLVLLRAQLASVLHTLARQHGRQGGWETARELAQQSLHFAERADHPLLLAESYRLLADTALHGSDYENAKLYYAEAARRFDILDLPQAAAAARVLLVPLLLQFGHDLQAAPHVAWLRANRTRAELGPEDRADIEDVLRVADAPQEPQT
jgi:nucleoside phosphorylase/tetratricopeptide (TPR) repeat protein